ncbi:MAG: CapA family protein [Acidobacteriaceae bacterium]
MSKAFKSSLLLLLAAVAVAVVWFGFNETRQNLIHGSDPVKPEQKVQPKTTKLFFAGDIMLSRNVGTKITEANDPSLPFANVKDEIKSSDLSFANLESPFYDKGARVTQGMVFKAEPAWISGLVDSGLKILSTANNHSFDQGKNGLTYTLNWLQTNGIKPVGTGTDCHQGLVEEINGIKFGFLTYSYAAYNDGGKVPDANVCDWNDQKQVQADIKTLKPEVDFLVVSSHMGTEYKLEPDAQNVEYVHSAIDAGTDLFIGGHPHWIQTTEQYKGKWIFYSLGNFVFDQMWSQETREGLTVEVVFKDKDLAEITVNPVIIDNYCCPRWANSEETQKILSTLGLTNRVIYSKNNNDVL